MDCREAGKLVNAYIDGSISDAELEQFIAHVRSCQSCMEELETYFTVDYALQALNDRSEERRVGKECRSRWSPYH